MSSIPHSNSHQKNRFISTENTFQNLDNLHDRLLANDSQSEQIKKIFEEAIKLYESSLLPFQSFDTKIKEVQIKINRILSPQNLRLSGDVMGLIAIDLDIKTLYRFSITSRFGKALVDKPIIERAKLIKPQWKSLNPQIAWRAHSNLHRFKKFCCSVLDTFNLSLKFFPERLQKLTAAEAIEIFSKKTSYSYIQHLKFDVLCSNVQIDEKKSTLAIFEASSQGSVKILKLLKKSGAKFYSSPHEFYPSKFPSTFVHIGIAAYLGRLKAVNYLVSIGISVDESWLSFTPLELACRQKGDCSEMVELLLKSGAKPRRYEYQALMLKYQICFQASEKERREIIARANELKITPAEYSFNISAKKINDKNPLYPMDFQLDLATREKVIVAASFRKMTPSDYISSIIIKDLGHSDSPFF